MNLKAEFKQKNQNQRQQKLKLEQSSEQTLALTQQPIDQPGHQQSCCFSVDEWQRQYVKAGANKQPELTAEKLKTFAGLSDLTDEDAQEIAESLILLSQLTYELFQLQQQNQEAKAQSTSTNASVDYSEQEKPLPPKIAKLPKPNCVTRKKKQ